MESLHPIGAEDVTEIQRLALGVRVSSLAFESCLEPLPGSRLAQADIEYGPFPPGKPVRAFLRASLDHALAWADVVTPMSAPNATTPPLRIRLAYGTSRSSWESAGAAVYLVEADEADLGVRHVELLARHIWEERRARLAMGDTTHADLLGAHLQALLPDLAPGNRPNWPGYGALSKIAALNAGLAEGYATYLYSLSSAAIHGVQWFDTDAFVPIGPNDIPSTEMLLRVLAATNQIVAAAVSSYVAMGGRDPIPVWADATAELWQRVPLQSGVDRASLPTADQILGRLE